MTSVPVGQQRHTPVVPGPDAFDFINRWRYWFAISGTIIVIGMVALGVKGLNFSIDFKGGVVWEVPTTATVAEVRAELGKIDPVLVAGPDHPADQPRHRADKHRSAGPGRHHGQDRPRSTP